MSTFWVTFGEIWATLFSISGHTVPHELSGTNITKHFLTPSANTLNYQTFLSNQFIEGLDQYFALLQIRKKFHLKIQSFDFSKQQKILLALRYDTERRPGITQPVIPKTLQPKAKPKATPPTTAAGSPVERRPFPQEGLTLSVLRDYTEYEIDAELSPRDKSSSNSQ